MTLVKLVKAQAKKVMRGLSWACSHGDCMNCPGGSCSHSCH